MTRFLIVLLPSLAGACRPGEDARVIPGGGYATITVGGHLDSLVFLPGGDSVEVQGVGKTAVPGGPPGILITYHPFVDLADTARVDVLAAALFQRLHLDSATAPFVVLRAVDRRAADRVGVYKLRQYGVVLERAANGSWRRR